MLSKVNADPIPHSPPKNRKSQDVPHQSGLAAESVCQPPKDKGANRTCCQCQKHSLGNILYVDFKRRRNVPEHEHHEKEIEGVQRPAKVRGHNDIFLTFSPLHL
jgi:hypothetical protein